MIKKLILNNTKRFNSTFFNREKEKKYIKEILLGKPQITVVKIIFNFKKKKGFRWAKYRKKFINR